MHGVIGFTIYNGIHNRFQQAAIDASERLPPEERMRSHIIGIRSELGQLFNVMGTALVLLLWIAHHLEAIGARNALAHPK